MREKDRQMQQLAFSRPLALISVAAPEDEALLAQWEAHLQPLQQARLISLWSMRHLVPGAQQEYEQQRHLEQADLVVLLISALFFAKSSCLTQMQAALNLSQTGSLRVIALLVRPVAWQESPLGSLTPWPSNGRAITLWHNQDEGWHACVQELRRLLGRRVSEALSPGYAQPPADRNWERMLRRLQRSYQDLLDQSLHGITWIEPGLSTRAGLVGNVTNLLFRLPQGGERLLAPGTSILDIYNEAEGELLVLGAPGAGKSTLLLDLAQRLVARAQTNGLHLLPVILRLSSWAIRQPELSEWIVEQVSQIYNVPQELCERWGKQGRLLPLLDGLDEIQDAALPACMAAINSYHRTSLTPLVVCSRQSEYEAQRERLALLSAVIVQPLSNAQIEDYLQVAGPSFASVQAALHQQQALWRLATTPLMLSVLLLTYRNASTAAVTQPDKDLVLCHLSMDG
jgi:hypothetical protein